jgi:shikimate dehydrogenase
VPGDRALLDATPGARVAAVIGDPVAHSLSPAIHNAAFAATGVDATYTAVRVAPDELAALMDEARTVDLLGLSVTMPHKAAILAHLDEVRHEAQVLDAVNCVLRDGDRLVGANTDGAGFVDALAAASVDLVGTRVVVLGAGGAARAVIHALAAEGVAELGIVNRSPERAKAAVLLGGRDARVAEVGDVPDFDVVVNATSVGMGESAGRSTLPVPADLLREGQVVVDLVYEPVETGLLAAARAAGARALDGVGMLVHQAAHAFHLWTGQEAPVAVMDTAAREAIEGKT